MLHIKPDKIESKPTDHFRQPGLSNPVDTGGNDEISRSQLLKYSARRHSSFLSDRADQTVAGRPSQPIFRKTLCFLPSKAETEVASKDWQNLNSNDFESKAVF